jgi:hypothetical protein
MPNIKGVLLVDWVKAIRGDKTGELLSQLSPADKEWIQSRVYITAWYPFEVYQKLVKIVIKHLGLRRNPKALFGLGYKKVDSTLKDIAHLFVREGSVVDTIESYSGVERLFFDFGSISVVFQGDRKAVLKFEGFPAKFAEFYYITIGWYSKLFEIGGAKNLTYKITKKSWEGDPLTEEEYEWSET